MLLLTLLLALPARAAGFDADAIVAALREYATYADQPLPILEGDDLAALAAGELVRIRDMIDPEQPQRAIGLQIFDHTRAELWVASGDGHFKDIEEFEYAELAELPMPRPGHRWLQYLHVPWPFADRFWVIDAWNNLDMVKATGGRMWEHPWRLVEDGHAAARVAVEAGKLSGVDTALLDKAVYTPVNRGAWLAIVLDDHTTLFGYHVTTVVGGSIPDALVARYSLHSFKRIFQSADERVPLILTHYDEAHERILGADNAPIPAFAVP